jgi:hypothetical protein
MALGVQPSTSMKTARLGPSGTVPPRLARSQVKRWWRAAKSPPPATCSANEPLFKFAGLRVVLVVKFDI